VRDSIEVARRNIPAIALVTTAFWPQGDFVAASTGMPNIPRVELPHPVAGSGESNMQVVADGIAPQIVALLTGETPS
jgi:hypothetical protein